MTPKEYRAHAFATGTTWADGFGRWHASVPLSHEPGEQRHSGHAQREANAARALIGAELTARGYQPVPQSVEGWHLRVTREVSGHVGRTQYGEV